MPRPGGKLPESASAAETEPGPRRGLTQFCPWIRKRAQRPGEQRGDMQPRKISTAWPSLRGGAGHSQLPCRWPPRGHSCLLPVSWRTPGGVRGARQERVKDVPNKSNLHAKVSPFLPPDYPRLVQTNQYFMSTGSATWGEAGARPGEGAWPSRLPSEGGGSFVWGSFSLPPPRLSAGWGRGGGTSSPLPSPAVSTAACRAWMSEQMRARFLSCNRLRGTPRAEGHSEVCWRLMATKDPDCRAGGQGTWLIATRCPLGNA